MAHESYYKWKKGLWKQNLPQPLGSSIICMYSFSIPCCLLKISAMADLSLKIRFGVYIWPSDQDGILDDVGSP